MRLLLVLSVPVMFELCVWVVVYTKEAMNNRLKPQQDNPPCF